MKNPRKAGSANPEQTQHGSPGYGSSAASVTSSSQELEGSDSDSAEADQDADDDEDGDEMAPSDTVIASNVDQTGHNVGMGLELNASIEKGRRHSPINAATKKQQSRRHKSSKPATHKEGQNAESDDDDYNGVDLISDSEGEEPTIERLEEKVIIESEEEYDCSTPPKLPSISDDGYRGFEGFDLQGDLFLSDVPYFDEQIGRTDPHILAEEIAIFNSTDFSRNYYDIELPPRLTPPRRVRFAEDVPDSDKPSAIASDTERNGNGSPGVPGVMYEEEGAPPGDHDSEHEDNDSSSGRSSGYESGYCVMRCEQSCTANNWCFQLILARQPRKKMCLLLQQHDCKHFSVAHPCRQFKGIPRQHQRQGGGSLLPPRVIAGGHTWVHGLPIRQNLWQSWTALAPSW